MMAAMTVRSPSTICTKISNYEDQRWVQKRPTKIHDHPSNPPVPDMNEIPYAIKPEKAPEHVPPAQNIPKRQDSIWRGYHRDSLNCQQILLMLNVSKK